MPAARAMTLAALERWAADQGFELVPAGAERRARPARAALDLTAALSALASARPLPSGALVVADEGEATAVRSLAGRHASGFARALARGRAAGFLAADTTRPGVALRRALAHEGVPFVLAVGAPADLAGRIGSLLAPAAPDRSTVHGTLAEVFDVGLLVTGVSGIGKSEAVLELVLRGHRLVADDVVDLNREGSVVYGTAPALARNHLEVRGVGILDLAELLGPAAVQERARVGLVVELVPWRGTERVERLGLDPSSRSFLGVELPSLEVPVSPGRNLGAILEVAVRNQLLKNRGRNAAITFERRLAEAIERRGRAWKG